jgi:serine O-acetyltransferase
MNYDTPLTFARTRALIASDTRRLFEANGRGGLGQRIFWLLLPTYQALFWYRLSRYCFLRGWRNTARVIFLFNLYRTRIEIPPTTYIGEACLIAHASGVVLYGVIGDRATIFGDAKIGGGIDNSINIGAGPGYPILGNDVILGYRSSVLGPYRVGDGARFGPFALAIFDVAPGSKLKARKSVIMQATPPEAPTSAPATPVPESAPTAAPSTAT